MCVLYLTPGGFDNGGICRYCWYQISALREIVGAEIPRTLSMTGPDGNGFEDPFAVDWHGSGQAGTAIFVDRATHTARALTTATRWRLGIVHAARVNLGPLLSRAAGLVSASAVLNIYGRRIWHALSQWCGRHMKRAGRIIADCHFTRARYVVDEGMHDAEPAVILSLELHEPSKHMPIAIEAEMSLNFDNSKRKFARP